MPDDLSFIPGTSMRESENLFLQVVFWFPHTLHGAHMCMRVHAHKINKSNKKVIFKESCFNYMKFGHQYTGTSFNLINYLLAKMQE